MYSHVVDGKVLDVTCKRMKHNAKHYVVYLGDEYIGQIFKMRFGWDVVYRDPTTLGIISGICNKWKCYDLLLKIYDKQRNDESI